MNSYNENLRTSVVNSLDEQANALKKTESALSAQEISLYYSQGALITANDKFDDTLSAYESQQDILASVNENNNASINVVDAATQEKKYVDQTISNTAVAASNVQIASNAVLHLAGDIGNVFSIVQAADYKSQIYDQALDARNYMDQTAYNAKLASQYAMESTMRASSISAGTVLNEAQSAGAALQALNDNYKAQFETTSQKLDAESTAVVEANNKEKKDEGLTEDLNIAYFGTRSAYELNNEELNSGLVVLENIPGDSVWYMTDKYFTVNFNPYIAPFCPADEITATYPVSQYYLIVVESSGKSTFSTTSADAAIATTADANGNLPYVAVGANSLVTSSSGKNYYHKKIQRNSVLDSNGKPIELGKSYCVFLYAKLADEYKKTINNFTDMLSAASRSFILTKQLKAATDFQYTLANNTGTNTSANPALAIGDSIHFIVKNENAGNPVEYRLMLLPTSPDKVGNLLSDANLRTVQGANQTAKKVADAAQALQDASDRLKKIKEDLETASENKKNETDRTKKNELTTLLTSLKQSGKDEEKAVAAARANLVKEMSDAANGIVGPKGIFFNTLLAGQVPMGSFTPVKLTANGKYQVILSEEMTDNFGNKLNDKDSYVPVVLSFSTAKASNVKQYSNALSDFVNTSDFSYSSTK